jgi:hypothetical protein
LGSHFREEGYLGYDGGLVHLLVQTKLDTHIHHQHAPVIFDLCAEKEITIHNFLRKEGQIQFDRWLPPILFNKWLEIIGEVYTYKYEKCDDIIKWKWGGKNNLQPNLFMTT